MKALLLVPAFLLAGCTTPQVNNAVAIAQTACLATLQAASTAQDIAKGGALQTVNNAAKAAQAVCLAVMAGSKIAQDPNTLALLESLSAQIKGAAPPQ